jgi:hypothetical protein
LISKLFDMNGAKHGSDCASFFGEKCDCVQKASEQSADAASESDKRKETDRLASELAKKWRVAPKLRRVRNDE